MNIFKYNKIVLLGRGGSGKSWLAKRIANITGYPLIHLDNEYWKPNWTPTPKEEWVKKQKDIIKNEKWIIDGNYNSSMELRFAAADLIIFLDINRVVCMWSAFRRHGKKRSDLPDYLIEKIDYEFVDFLKWIWSYKKTGKKRILDLHKKYSEKEFLVLKSRKSVMKFLKDCMMNTNG